MKIIVEKLSENAMLTAHLFFFRARFLGQLIGIPSSFLQASQQSLVPDSEFSKVVVASLK